MDFTVDNTIFLCESGSRLYQMNNENSDKDFSGVYIPTLDEILLGTYQKGITFSTGDCNLPNTANDLDFSYYSFPRFFELLKKGSHTAIDLFAAKDTQIIETCEIWERIYDNRRMFYSKNMRGFLGMFNNQALRYTNAAKQSTSLKAVIAMCKSISEPNTKISEFSNFLPTNDHLSYTSKMVNDKVTFFYNVLDKKFPDSTTYAYLKERAEIMLEKVGDVDGNFSRDSVDWKRSSHALRCGYSYIDILNTNEFEYPCSKQSTLIDVKNANVSMVELENLFKSCSNKINKLKLTSKLQENINTTDIDELYISILRDFYSLS
ncbi:MAG: nucleotidyltransferase domain-containing protein [Ghiorsea sp.]